jgi:hypothetical protein
LEEFTLYLNTINNNLSWTDVLPYNEIISNGLYETADKYKYTHMWFESKFSEKNINLIKNKIKTVFPEYYNLVEFYDNNILSKIDIKYYPNVNYIKKPA